MGQYWEDWSSYTVGDDPVADGPAGWSARWDIGNVSVREIVADASAPAGKALRIGKSTYDRALLTLNAVDADAGRDDVAIALLFRCVAIPNYHNFPGVVVRGSGTGAAETGYYFAATANHGALGLLDPSLGRYVGGSSTWMVDPIAADALTPGELYWLYLSAQGDQISASWAAESDPATILGTTTQTSAHITAVGWAGILAFGQATTEILAVGIGTDGDAAPTASPGGGDVTAPVLTGPSGSATGSTTASGSVTTDEGNGTLYAVCTTSATAPSVAQIKAGNDHAGSPAAYATSQAVSATGAQSVTATGLTASTGYYWHFLHTDAATNDSNIVSSSLFTTDAAAPGAVEGISLILYDGAAPVASRTGLRVLWWDSPVPSGAPVFEAAAETTDGSGQLVVDISASTALSVGANGFMLVYDEDGGDYRDSLVFASRLAVQDIS